VVLAAGLTTIGGISAANDALGGSPIAVVDDICPTGWVANAQGTEWTCSVDRRTFTASTDESTCSQMRANSYNEWWDEMDSALVNPLDASLGAGPSTWDCFAADELFVVIPGGQNTTNTEAGRTLQARGFSADIDSNTQVRADIIGCHLELLPVLEQMMVTNSRGDFVNWHAPTLLWGRNDSRTNLLNSTAATRVQSSFRNGVPAATRESDNTLMAWCIGENFHRIQSRIVATNQPTVVSAPEINLGGAGDQPLAEAIIGTWIWRDEGGEDWWSWCSERTYHFAGDGSGVFEDRQCDGSHPWELDFNWVNHDWGVEFGNESEGTAFVLYTEAYHFGNDLDGFELPNGKWYSSGGTDSTGTWLRLNHGWFDC
jgi:hypothetical protein